MVLVNVFRVATVVHAVMGGRVEYIFKPAHFVNRFGVNPELIQRVQGRNQGKVECIKAKKGERQTKPESPDYLEAALPQRHGKVVLLTLMMHHVPTPKQVDFMTHAMGPIVSQVGEQEQYQPIHPGFIPAKKSKVGKKHLVNPNGKDAHKKPGEL